MSSAELARRSSFEGHSMREKREREKGGLTRERERPTGCVFSRVCVCVLCVCARGVACVRAGLPVSHLVGSLQRFSHLLTALTPCAFEEYSSLWGQEEEYGGIGTNGNKYFAVVKKCYNETHPSA